MDTCCLMNYSGWTDLYIKYVRAKPGCKMIDRVLARVMYTAHEWVSWITALSPERTCGYNRQFHKLLTLIQAACCINILLSHAPLARYPVSKSHWHNRYVRCQTLGKGYMLIRLWIIHKGGGLSSCPFWWWSWDYKYGMLESPQEAQPAPSPGPWGWWRGGVGVRAGRGLHPPV